MKRIVWLCACVGAASLGLMGCSTKPETIEGQAQLSSKVENAVSLAKTTDPGLQRFFDTAVGYAVFPTVGKGAVGVGGAYGRGELYEAGSRVGYCTLTQGTVGFAIGGQAYTELIFFEDQAALDRFKSGNCTFSAQISSVALKSGASANAKFAEGVAVFTMDEQGLMAEVSIGGQKFSYEPAQ